MPIRSRITGTGMAVPDCIVDNHLLSRCMSTSDEWIVQRTGISERRVSPDTYRMLLRLAEAPDKAAYMRDVKDRGLDGNIDSSLTVSDLAVEASRMALKHAGLTAEDLDCIVESSTLPDFAYPATGCVTQGKLGLTSTPVFNLAQGCAGFVYGLSLADQFIRGGMYEKVLVIGAELLSSAFDYTDAGRDMAVLFADGGGAAVLEAHEEGTPPRGLISHHLHSDGSAIDALTGEIWGSSTFPPVSKKKIDDGRTRPRMNGRAVFVHAVRRVREVVQECLGANGLLADDIDLFIFHQANLRIVESMAESFKIPESRMLNNIQRYGNTAAASVPICLHEAVMGGRMKEGDLVMLVAFGTGFSWGATLIRW
ncbi:MAG TPA: beta-ketoacyl-ACP synthase III [Methylomirabilota bacterium]|nr:beta-ketoacyl-ACP synthase III [Methylomirabilota bacterium]